VAEQYGQEWQCSQETCLIRSDVIDHVNTGQHGYDSTTTLATWKGKIAPLPFNSPHLLFSRLKFCLSQNLFAMLDKFLPKIQNMGLEIPLLEKFKGGGN